MGEPLICEQCGRPWWPDAKGRRFSLCPECRREKKQLEAVTCSLKSTPN